MKNKLQRTFHFSLHPSTSSGDDGGQGRPVGRKSPSSSAYRSRGGVCDQGGGGTAGGSAPDCECILYRIIYLSCNRVKTPQMPDHVTELDKKRNITQHI